MPLDLDLLRHHGPTRSAAAQTKFPQTPAGPEYHVGKEDAAGAAKPRE